MFYTYRQNNSGGQWAVEPARGISVYVIVEADSHEQANTRANDIGIYFGGASYGRDCSCCGSRWSEAYEDDGTDKPEIYGTVIHPNTTKEEYKTNSKDALSEEKTLESKDPDGFIHFADGTFEPFWK